MRAFWYRGSMAGITTHKWQVDVRFDGWLPLSVRRGRNIGFGRVWRIHLLNWCVVAGRLTQPTELHGCDSKRVE